MELQEVDLLIIQTEEKQQEQPVQDLQVLLQDHLLHHVLGLQQEVEELHLDLLLAVGVLVEEQLEEDLLHQEVVVHELHHLVLHQEVVDHDHHLDLLDVEDQEEGKVL